MGYDFAEQSPKRHMLEFSIFFVLQAGGEKRVVGLDNSDRKNTFAQFVNRQHTTSALSPVDTFAL